MKRPSESFRRPFQTAFTKPKSRSCANKIAPEIVGRILVSDLRRSPDACSANKCRIRESDLQLCTCLRNRQRPPEKINVSDGLCFIYYLSRSITICCISFLIIVWASLLNSSNNTSTGNLSHAGALPSSAICSAIRKILEMGQSKALDKCCNSAAL